MKNNKKQLVLVAMLSCVSIGTFNTVTIHAMETNNMQKIRDLLEELQRARMDLVGDMFSTDFNQLNLFATSARNLNNNFANMQRSNESSIQAIKGNLRLITNCENALKAFVSPSPLAETVDPEAWPAINKIFTILRELKKLVKAQQYTF